MIMFARGLGLIVSLAFWLTILWATLDAAIRPQGAYEALGHKKVYWVVGLALGLLIMWTPLIGLLAIVAAIVYLVEYRPKLRQIARGSGGW
ncbi:MAG: hypothetical protein QOF57_2840 [Frankiaceae bacterium]|jgi:hypothetical protein|nr:hypothetical protein [Frankiaceae bacterium]